MQNLKTDGICPHCKMDIQIRNPSGYCDHLYYPCYCKICMEREKTKLHVMKEMECAICKAEINHKHRKWILKESPEGMGGDEEKEQIICYDCRYSMNVRLPFKKD